MQRLFIAFVISLVVSSHVFADANDGVGTFEVITRYVPVISTNKSLAANTRIVASSVVGLHCPTGRKEDSHGDYQKALLNALSKAPGTNALLQAEIRVLKRSRGKDCIEVKGHAIHI